MTKYLNPDNCKFSLTETGLLRAEVDGRFTCLRAVLRRLFPLRDPSRFISLREDGGDEVGIIEDLSSYDRPTRKMLEQELEFYYSIPVVTEINAIDYEFGFVLWDVETTRGPHEFYVKGRGDNLSRSGDELLITDIHNCRYHIPEVSSLSPTSKKVLEHAL